MAVRAALLTRKTGSGHCAIQAAQTALGAILGGVEVRVLPADRSILGSMAQLAAFRPDLVVSEAFGPSAVEAALYRAAAPHSRLLLCAFEPPRRCGLFDRMVLSRADGFLADGEDMACVVEKLRLPVPRFYSMAIPSDIDLFLAGPGRRDAAAAHRLIYAGDLSPDSGAADVLISLAAWAERHHGRDVEIWWAGEGDLSGVLEAQPLPDNVSQRFLGRLDRRGLAAAFASCGVLLVPPLAEDTLPLVPEALSSGLVVLGSRRAGKVRQIVQDGVLGWTFDPLRQDDMLLALGKVLGSHADELDRMRDNGRAMVRRAASESFAERLRAAVATVLAAGMPKADAVKLS